MGETDRTTRAAEPQVTSTLGSASDVLAVTITSTFNLSDLAGILVAVVAIAVAISAYRRDYLAITAPAEIEVASGGTPNVRNLISQHGSSVAMSIELKIQVKNRGGRHAVVHDMPVLVSTRHEVLCRGRDAGNHELQYLGENVATETKEIGPYRIRTFTYDFIWLFESEEEAVRNAFAATDTLKVVLGAKYYSIVDEERSKPKNWLRATRSALTRQESEYPDHNEKRGVIEIDITRQKEEEGISS